MSLIVKATVRPGWSALDKQVALINRKELTDGAYRLYGYLIGLKVGAKFSDTFIMKGLGITKNTLATRKAELKKNNLIKSVQIAPRVYVLFIGNTQIGAKETYKNWEEEQDK